MKRSTYLVHFVFLIALGAFAFHTKYLLEESLKREREWDKLYHQRVNLTNSVLDNQFKAGIYAAILTMRDEKYLCAGKIKVDRLVEISMARQDSLKSKVVMQ